MEDQNVRISVANLAAYLMNIDTRKIVAIGIMNKKRFEKGEPFLQALGGAATMSPNGMNYARASYKAVFLGEGEDANDARFVVPRDHLEAALAWFQAHGMNDVCETDPMREVTHELEQETFDGSSVLPSGALNGAYAYYHGIFCQEVGDGKGTSERAAKQNVPTRRLFFVHTLCVPSGVFSSVLSSPYVKLLTEEDLDTTQMGRTKGVTKDGIPMADNLCNWVPGHTT